MAGSENRRVNIFINMKETGQTAKELNAKFRKLRAELNLLKTGSAEYNAKMKELRTVGKQIEAHRAKVRGVASAWSKVRNEVKAFGIVAIAAVTAQALYTGINNLIERNAKLDDSFADVMKTTGLTKDEVKGLSREFKKFNTRSSRRELLMLARDAGKLGIKGSKNIAQFVKAADQINIALGEDLGDGAIKQLGKLNEQFNTAKIHGYEQAMLKTGSAINELGASSVASEQFLVNYTKRLAGVSKQAGISIQDTLGMASALDNLGLQAEMASTAIGQTVISMFKDTATFAGIAGVSTQEFSEVLKTDANKALLLFLSGLQGNNEGMTQMTEKFNSLGINGSRAISVLASLAGNIELVSDQQAIANAAFAKGTSLTEEFNIKNETLAAKLSKLRAVLAGMFVNSSLVKGLERIVDLMSDWVSIPLSKTLERERQELNVLVTQIQLASDSQERRNKLIRQLQESYPEFLGNLDAEKVTNQQLADRLAEVNEQMINKIILQKEDEGIFAQQEKIARLRIDLRKRERDAVKQLIAAEQKHQFSTNPDAGLSERLQQAREQLAARDNRASAAVGLAPSMGNSAADAAAQMIRSLEAMAFNLERQNEELTEMIANRDELAAELQLPFQLNRNEPPTAPPSPTEEPPTNQTPFEDQEESSGIFPARERIEIEGMEMLAAIERIEGKALEIKQLAALSKEEIDEKLTESNKKRAEERQKQIERELQIEKARFAALKTSVQGFTDLVMSSMEFVGAEGNRMANFQKLAALFQIGVDTAAAISALTAASEANPANSVTFGGAGAAQFISGLARIFGNMAQAKKILSSRSEPRFFLGGHTGSGFGAADASGARPAGIVHENEYVVPSFVLQEPKVIDTVRMLEALRQEKVRARGFALGGATSAESASAIESGSTSPATLAQLDPEMLERLEVVLSKLSERLEEGIEAEVSWDRLEGNIQNAKTLKQSAGL